MSKNYFYECTECGSTYSNLGGLHSHAEKHTSFSLTPKFDELMEYTKIHKVVETEEVELSEVEETADRNALVDYFTGVIGLKS